MSSADQPLIEKEQQVSVEDLSPKQVAKLRKSFREDEIGYLLGIWNMMLTIIIVSRWPGLFWILHCAKAVFFLSWRYRRFKKWKGELYLMEWCYFVTYYTFIGCALAFTRVTFGYQDALAPYNSSLLRAGFALATGALAWAVIIFRNSIIFHDIDQIHGLFIHLSPALFFFCLRWGAGLGPSVTEEWFPDMFRVCPDATDMRLEDQCIWRLWCDTCGATVTEIVVLPICLYLFLWAMPYYITRFCLLPGWIERTGRDTLFALVLHDNSQNFFVKHFPDALKPFAYMLQHFLLVVVSSACSIVFWNSFWLHGLFIFTLVSVAAYNGATYTFRVFATRYATQQLRKHPSILTSD